MRSFDRSLFWRPRSTKEHATECWRDPQIWAKAYETKDDEVWGWVGFTHPTYLPFDEMTKWLENLAAKYEDKTMKRPEWMMAGENEDKFIKRIVTIYEWKGSNEDEANSALTKLFGKSGADLEVGIEGQLTFIKKKASSLKSRSKKIEPT